MDLSGVTGTANTADIANTATSRSGLADNYNTFLVLLTAQLQNQDPLSPMDSTQFTQQLVQYSQVEQQIRTNEQLSGLVTQYQAASAGAALSYLGKDALIEADTSTLPAGGAATWAYNLPEAAASAVEISIRNASGVEVFSADGVRGMGDHAFNWDGTMTNGQKAPAGVYRMVVSAKDAAGETITPTMTVRENILGVDFSGTTPMVITSSGSRELGQVRAVMDPN
jgi:flagellar basal-body rod modification protein FlgD